MEQQEVESLLLTKRVTMGNTQDKRYYPRYQVSQSLLRIAEDNNQADLGEVMSIGYGGFSTRSNRFLSNGKGMRVNLLLSKDQTQTSLFTNAEVVWSCRETNPYRYGFKFEDLNVQQKSIIENYLELMDKVM